MENSDVAETVDVSEPLARGPGPRGVAGLLDEAVRKVQAEVEVRGSPEVRKARRQVLRGIRVAAYALEMKGDATPRAVDELVRSEVFGCK
ncbi:hypothetical protein M2318_003935 [Metapseudomonas resinovorans]